MRVRSALCLVLGAAVVCGTGDRRGFLDAVRHVEQGIIVMDRLEILLAFAADDRRPRIVYFVNAVAETHQPERIVLVFGHFDEFIDIAVLMDHAQHLDHRLIGAAVKRTGKRGDPRRDRRVKIDLGAADDPHRFFEASWTFKKDGKYYFTYSTGDSHLLCYAIGDNPYGPFTYKGVILTPVVGWTTHHAIIEWEGKWYLFHHDSVPSGGKSWLRSLKVCELTFNADGTIETIEGID